MKNACTSESTGRSADRRESCLMERSGTIIHLIFSILRNICLGWIGLRPLFLCTPILGKLPLVSRVPKLLRIYPIILLYGTIIVIFFAIIRIIPQPIIAIIQKIFFNYSNDCKAKMAIWDGIHCRNRGCCASWRHIRGNNPPRSEISVAGFAAGGVAREVFGGGRVDASMAACMGQK